MSGPAASRASRWGIAAALFVGCCVFFGSALLDEPLSDDEHHWMLEATSAWQLAVSGRFEDPFWSQNHLLWGYASPAVSKCLMGIVMATVGQGDPKAVTPPSSLTTTPAWQAPSAALRAGRLASVVFGSLAVSTLFLFLSRTLSTRIAFLSTLLLATSPVWARVCRRALTDVQGVAMSLLVLPLYASARDAALAQRRRIVRLTAWTGVGAVAGLSVGCKFSAAGSALGLAALLVLEGFRRSGGERERFRGVPGALGAALLCGGVAVAVFVSTYPYLWPDPVGRFRGIVTLWRTVRESHVTGQFGVFAGSFRPGLHSFSVAANLLVLPGGWLSWAMLPALLGALWLRGKSLSEDGARIVAWALATPAVLIGAFVGGQNLHDWVVWAGVVGATISAIAVRGSLRRVVLTPTLLILAAAALGAFAIVIATTYIAWPRYFAPLFPALTVAAAVGYDDLRRSIAVRAGDLAARWVDAGIVAGILSVVSAFPRMSRAQMGLVTSHELGVVPVALQGTAAVCLTLAVAAGVRGLARQETAAAPR